MFECAEAVERAKARKARHDERRPTARERGYDSKWDKARAEFLAEHPHCRVCGEPATVVDHIVPHRGDPKLFWDRKNWQSLCAHHHNGAKQSQERRSPRKD
jgi:5-methylcytosine-specific restriction endonuclease McrA